MQGLHLDRYRIDAKLGEGGMGVVWRAHDPRLGRDVALKVLPDARVGDESSRARLLREARAAAALSHPNILTVFDVGEAGGHVFIAMEYVPGRPLSEIIGSTGVPVAEAVRLGVQISAALGHAHERGIIHRDIKPSNVLVTPSGDAKVLDFGLATWAVSEHSDTRSFDLSRAGELVGTPVAMAPELWRGARADARSDVWAFGALLYTLLEGKPPFHGRTEYELSTAICTTDPPPLPERVPAALRALVSRCLERDPERRFRSAMEVHAALQAIASGERPREVSVAENASPALEPRHRASRRPVAIAVVAALVLAGIWGLLALRARGHASNAGPRSITSLAVLPLDNFSRDADQQYFADGMTDQLITSLAQLGIVRVISRTSVMRFRGSRLPLPEISRQLGVDAIVEGSIEQVGGRVRITAQLVRAANDEHLWARSYEREIGDALALQDEVAQAIANEIRGRLTPAPETPQAARRATEGNVGPPRDAVPPSVVQAYLRGRDQEQKWTTESTRRALTYYDQALAADSTFAAALAARAGALLFLSGSPDTAALARSAITRALALAPELGEAHAAQAKLLFEHDWSWEESEREFRRALELNPNNADAHHHYSHLLAALGRVREAREQAQLMLALDPLAPASYNHLSWLEFECGNFDKSRAANAKTMELDPGYVAGAMQSADVELAARNWAGLRKALDESRRLGADVDPLKFQLVDALEHGRHEEGVRILREVDSPADQHLTSWSSLAAWYVVMGRKDDALVRLDSAFVYRDYSLLFANLDPSFAELRSDPRYAALRRRMRLPL
jgi:serine/threonine-protein kinase